MPSPGVLTTADVGNEWSTPRKWIEQGLRAGDRFGHFVVQDKLGSGGMATVFRAHDERLDREVALKLLHFDLGDRHDQRLLREAQALARLSHANVVQVFEVGEERGLPFIAMELVKGISLADWQREPKPWREAIAIYVQAGRGLAAAHECDLIHRDFKPGNAILDERGRVRVLDFGLARSVGAVEPTSTPSHPSDSAFDVDLTRTGSIMGTLAFMAPEQRRGEPASAASDQFSFFAALYEAMYGERPYAGDSSGIVLGATTEVRAPRSDTAVPDKVRRVLLRGLAIAPQERFGSMEAALEALERVAAPRRGVWLPLAGLGATAALGLGLYQVAEVGFRCDGAQAEMDAVWNDERRTAIRTALETSGNAYAQTAWLRISAKLDAYAHDWVEQRTETCRATRVNETQPEALLTLRVACLERRRASLRQTLAVLARGGEDAVLGGTGLVSNLPALERCEDVAALQADVAAPTDPAVAERVEAIRSELARAAALRELAALEESDTACAEAVTSARASGYAPVLAEALVEHALSKIEIHAFADAERLLREAYSLATEHEHRSVEAKAAAELAFVVGAALNRHAEGLVWGEVALAASRRPSAEPDAEARAATNVADVYLADNGNFEKARDLYLLALPQWEAAHGSDHPELGAIAHNLGQVQAALGDDEAAQENLERSRDIVLSSLGPRHPTYAQALQTLARHVARTDLEAALPMHEEALQVLESALGSDSLRTIYARTLYAGALRDAGRFEASKGAALRALEDTKVESTPPELRIRAYAALSSAEEALGHDEAALAAAEHAHEGARQAFPDDTVMIAAYGRRVGRMLLKLDRHDEAAPLLETALRVARETFGDGDYELVPCLLDLGELALRREDWGRAEALGTEALAIMEARGHPTGELAHSRFLLARGLFHTEGQDARARALATASLEDFVGLGERASASVNAVQAWLDAHPSAD